MIGLTVLGLMRIGRRDVNWNICLSAGEKAFWGLLCVLTEIGVLGLWMCRRVSAVYCLLGFDTFCGCLLAACVMDVKEKMVYRFVWVAASVAAVEYLLLQPVFGSVTEYLLFAALQQCLFSRLYGRADCYAFSVCALVWMADGETFRTCVLHMAISFILLATVQLLRGNVHKNGRLRDPVPMLPYIAVGFAICFCIQSF